MLSFLIIAGILAVSLFLFLRQRKFGKIPSGDRLARIKHSPNYRNGSFQNLSPTPNLTEGVSIFAVMKEFFFSKKERNKPASPIPSAKTILKNLDPNAHVLVWFGHSSYFIQIDGKKILVDPVLSGGASPVKFTTPSFPGSDVYSAEEIPEIDFLFISHDHWDHADYETLQKIKCKKVVCGLGTGAHLEAWGVHKEIIFEMDWHDTLSLGDGFIVTSVPARHFSGRGLSRNKSLWVSYALQTPSLRIFIGGDTGYDKHFAAAGEKFGGFDLAILENGQYNKYWKYIHMMPEEVLQAGKDLRATRIFPVHSSKFALATHAWDEPLRKITALNKNGDSRIITPMIGELVNLKNERQTFSPWWELIS